VENHILLKFKRVLIYLLTIKNEARRVHNTKPKKSAIFYCVFIQILAYIQVLNLFFRKRKHKRLKIDGFSPAETRMDAGKGICTLVSLSDE